MSNVFINSLQLNADGITCNITESSPSKSYNNNKISVYGKPNTVNYSTSGGPEKYRFNFTLWKRGGDGFSSLLATAERIYNEIQRQVTDKMIHTISCDDQPIYMNKGLVNVVVDDFDLRIRGVDGVQHLNFGLDCTIAYFSEPIISIPPPPTTLTRIDGVGSDSVSTSTVSDD